MSLLYNILTILAKGFLEASFQTFYGKKKLLGSSNNSKDWSNSPKQYNVLLIELAHNFFTTTENIIEGTICFEGDIS